MIMSVDDHTHSYSFMNCTTSTVTVGSIFMINMPPVLTKRHPKQKRLCKPSSTGQHCVQTTQHFISPHPLLDEASTGSCHANEIVPL